MAGLLKLKERTNLDPKRKGLANVTMECAQISVVQTAQAIMNNYSDLVPRSLQINYYGPLK